MGGKSSPPPVQALPNPTELANQQVNAYVNSIFLENTATGTFDFDDLYICDLTGSYNFDFLGDIRVEALFPDDASIKLGYLYMTAHYLVSDLRAAMGGLFSASVFLTTSRSAGNVAESYGIPSSYMDDPIFAYYGSTAYGMKFLSFVWSNLRGNFGVVAGATQP